MKGENTVKRYLLFAGKYYYPSGGWDDLEDTSDDLNALHEKARAMESSKQWWQIVDTQTLQKIMQCEEADFD
jgi:hypothetical protein